MQDRRKRVGCVLHIVLGGFFVCVVARQRGPGSPIVIIIAIFVLPSGLRILVRETGRMPNFSGCNGLWSSSAGRIPCGQRQQSERVVNRIFTRFPTAPMADDDGPPAIFGKGSELLSLTLSKPNEQGS